MIDKARVWLAVAGGAAAAVIGLSGASAAADPTAPIPPAPVTVTPAAVPFPAAVAQSAPIAVAQSAPIAVAQSAPIAVAPTPPQPAASPALPPAPTPTLVPAASGTLTDYFKDKHVTLEPQKAQDFTALNITLPMPAGWSQVPDPNVVDPFAVIANRAAADLYTPNAQVVVYKLVGDVDPKDAITHGFVDSQQLLAWQTTDASLADFNGFPSSLIEGTYRSNDQTLNTSRRYVITTAGPDKYLVSLSVTTTVNQAVAAASATDAIVNGFRVSAPTP